MISDELLVMKEEKDNDYYEIFLKRTKDNYNGKKKKSIVSLMRKLDDLSYEVKNLRKENENLRNNVRIRREVLQEIACEMIDYGN